MMKYIVDAIEDIVILMQSNAKITPALRAALNNEYLLVDADPFVPIPFFMPGHVLEIANRLDEKTEDPINAWRKYPAVLLKMDIEEDYRGGMVDYNLNLAIINYTDKNFNAEQRIANVFKPILHPLYEAFMEELKNSGNFVWAKDQEKPLHKKIDRLYYGNVAKNGNTENVFSDPLDAIEIINLKISSYIC